MTEVVNAHGCLLKMKTRRFVPVTMELMNSATAKSSCVRVVCFRRGDQGSLQFAVERAEPDGALWGISIPAP